MFSAGSIRDATEVDEPTSELMAMNAGRNLGGRIFQRYVVHNFFKSFDSAHVFEQYRSRHMSEYSVVLEISNATRSDRRYLFDIFSFCPEKRICFAQEREVSEEVLLVVGSRKYVKASDYAVGIQAGKVEESSLNSELPTIVYSIRFHNSWKLAVESRNNVLLICEEYGADNPKALFRSFINTGLTFYIPYYKVSVPRTYENLVSLMFSYEVVGSKREYNGVLVRYLQYYHKALQDYVHRVGYSVYIDQEFIDNPTGARFAADLLINYVNFERSIKAHSDNERYRDLFLFCDAACGIARREVTNIPEDQDSGEALDNLCAIYVLTCDDRKYFVDKVENLYGRFLEAMITFNRHYRAISVIQTYMNMLSVEIGNRQGIIIPEVVPRLRESIRAVIGVFTKSRSGPSWIEEIARMYENGSEIEQETIAAISMAAIGSALSLGDRLMYIPHYRSMFFTYQKRRDFVRSGCVLSEDNSAAMFDTIRNGAVLGLIIAHAVVYEIEQLHRMGYIPKPIGVMPSVTDRENLIKLCDDLLLNASRIGKYSNHKTLLRNLVREQISGVHCAPKVEKFVRVYGKNDRAQRRRATRPQEEVSTSASTSASTSTSTICEDTASAAADNVINSALEDARTENVVSPNKERVGEAK
ncbi:hypothetical protein [Anaplasma bovis]|uniref:hypothetical protein n=1 Tax=Anaplasma bovis TaxID=186733 RepID=UPI002FEF4A71